MWELPRASVLGLCLALCSVAGAEAGSATYSLARILPEDVPDFSADTSRITIESLQSGNWSDASTWLGNQVPGNNNIVLIRPGHVVTINNTSASAYTIAVDGTLRFAPTVNTRLTVTNLQVMAGIDGMGTPGVLEVGTAANPIASSANAEIVIASTPLGGGVSDPLQFGTGIIAFGKVVMHGAVRTPTFVRLAVEPRAGATTLTLTEPVSGWRLGDRLVLPDTRHIKESEVTFGGWLNAVNQWEERTLLAVSPDGRTLTLNTPLQYDHLGARDLDGVLELLPHVGNLARNVIVRSADPAGTRGHMVGIHMADLDIRYALFRDLGRTTFRPLNTTTNHVGRYPIHIHHVSGPLPTPVNGYQFTLLGNAVDGGSAATQFKWGIAVHGSHYGLIQDNVVYNYNGAAIATEDGSESYNVFDHNFVLRGMGEPTNEVDEARSAMGTEGVGFWFRGPNNFVRNNVAANFQNSTTEAAYGFVYQFRFLGDIKVPNFKGADTMGLMGPNQFTLINGNSLPLLQFENNEAYGAMQGGLTYWWISSLDPQPVPNAIESVIKDFKAWHIYNKGVYIYPGQKVTFDGLTIRGSYSAASRCCGDGVFFADYMAKDIVIRNSDIQGMQQGVIAPMAGFGPNPNLTIADSYLRNWENLTVPSVGSVNGCWMDNKLVVLRNSVLDMAPGINPNHIAMVRDVANAPECLAKLSEMRVYAYNGNALDNFQVYHPDPAILPRPPANCIAAPHPGVNGPTCQIPPVAPVPTASLTAAPPTIDKGQSTTLSWSASNATTVFIDHFPFPLAASGTLTVSPAQTTVYTMTVTGAAGSVTASATVTVRIPTAITWNAPADIVYGTALSTTQLNADVQGTAVPGTFAYSPPPGTVLNAGSHTLTVTFTPTDSAHFISSTKSVPIVVSKATPVIAWAAPASILSGTAIGPTQLNASVTAQGATVDGTLAYTPVSGTVLAPGSHTLSVTFTPANTNNYNSAAASVPIAVKETPIVSWSPPANITYGTALSAAQLNARATVDGLNVPGTFAYTPASGVLDVGTHTLSVTFTPADPASYVAATASVQLTVTKATPVITWVPPANIVYGTALSAAQLNATANAPGSFAYTPASGILNAGTHTLSVTFTPTSTLNYNTAIASVSLTVLKATPVISWATPANIVAGTALGSTQLNATVTPSGTQPVYSPGTGTILPVGAAQLLSVTFTPADPNYNAVSKSVPITVTAAGTAPPVTAPVKIGNLIAGTFADATGHSGQSHLVFAPNANVWWLFTLSSAHDALGDRTVQTYVSSGPDLGSATWTAAAVSPTLANTNGATSSRLAGGRSLGVAVRSINGVDYAHVFISAAFDGQNSSNGHSRATLGATSISWGAWNNPGAPNTASEWQGPVGTGNSGASTKSSWGNSVGISSSGYIHHFSVVMDQEVDCNVGRSTNPDIAATWTNAWGNNVNPTGNTGTSPPWTTAVIDKTMTFECKALAFAPLASDVMLAVYSNGAVAQPNMTNLRYQRSGTGASAGVWTNIPGNGGGGQGNVFSANQTINQNDWALVPVNATTVYAFRRNGTGTAVQMASYSATGNGWSTLTGSAAPPLFTSGVQSAKAGAGVFGATDGTSVWLFVINGSDTVSNSILYTKLSAGVWSPWATVPGTNSGTHTTRNFLSGYQKPNTAQIGLVWTEGATNFDVYTTALNISGTGPASSATITAPASGATVSGSAVTVSATATPGSGTVAGVQFVLDGVNLGAEDTTSPYEVSWDTTAIPNGTHFLSAVARDSNGGTGAGNTITVTVLNDTAGPTVAMTAPSSGATVSGTLLISATAADDNGVAGVQFLLDGVPLGAEVTTAPYYFLWNTSAVPGGPHTLSARARDTAGNLRTSATINIAKLIVTPTVTWSAPAPLLHPTALGPQQLNATTTVPGAFAYSPSAGTMLPVGTDHTLTVTFTPTDTVNFTTASANVLIAVIDKTPPAVTAPPSTSVPATEIAGARGNVAGSVGSQGLNAFLSAASATDAGDATPARLPVEALINGTWTAVASDTLFPKGDTSVRFGFRDASGNTASKVSVLTVTGRISDEPTVKSTVSMGGGRLQSLQSATDGGWAFKVGTPGCGTPTGSCPNTFGIIALGLLATDERIGGESMRAPAIKAGNELVARYQIAMAQTPPTAPYHQDIEFLVGLTRLTGNPLYESTAQAWFQVNVNMFPNAADKVNDIVARRHASRLRTLAIWDAASMIRAAKAVGRADYALAAATHIRNIEWSWKDTDPSHSFGRGPVDNPQSYDYTILAFGSLLWALHDLPGFDAPIAEYRNFLLAQQDLAGSWAGGNSQTTAYVMIGLASVSGAGTEAAIRKAADNFLAYQFTNGGFPFSTAAGASPSEYSQVNAEVTRAMSMLFSTRAGENVSVTPAQLSTITFSEVTSSGVTTVVAIDEATAPQVSGSFDVVGGLTYQVTTTAAITGDIVSCFSVPWINDAATFDAVRILHGEGGVLVDRTILAPDQPAPDFATRRVCARTSSLSPFAVALERPDVVPPVLTTPGDAVAEATGPAGAPYDYVVSALDDMYGAVAVDCSPASGSVFPLGATTVTCSAADGQGNVGSASFIVTVRDTTGPVVNVPANVTIAPKDSRYAFTASAIDAVDGSVTPICTPPSGTLFEKGTTTVVCHATDARGNAGAASFTVTVKGGGRSRNKAPEAQSAEYSIESSSTLTGFLEARDADGDPLTFTLVEQPTLGTVTIDPHTGAFTYVAGKRADERDEFTFRVSDGKKSSQSERVRITIKKKSSRKDSR